MAGLTNERATIAALRLVKYQLELRAVETLSGNLVVLLVDVEDVIRAAIAEVELDELHRTVGVLGLDDA